MLHYLISGASLTVCLVVFGCFSSAGDFLVSFCINKQAKKTSQTNNSIFIK